MKIVLVMLISSLALFATVKEVTVSILPQKYFIEKIAKDKVFVNVMVRQGFSPATYEPKTSQMKKLFKSEVYFAIGVPFEKVWLDKFKSANSKMMIVDTSANLEKIKMTEHNHHQEESKHDKDEHHDEHHHAGLDPHVWLDPVLVKKQAKIVLDTLITMDTVNKIFYEKNYQIFIQELDELHHELHETLESLEHSAFMVFHPSWGYFAKRYHLEQIAVEKEGKEPKPRELTHLIKEASTHSIKVVFVSPQFSQKAVNVIAQSIKANVVILDPLAYDYINNLKKVALSIKQSYQ